LLGINPILILFGAGLVGMAGRQLARANATPSIPGMSSGRSISRLQLLPAAIFTTGVVAVRPSLARIGLFFLKVGAVL